MTDEPNRDKYGDNGRYKECKSENGAPTEIGTEKENETDRQTMAQKHAQVQTDIQADRQACSQKERKTSC